MSLWLKKTALKSSSPSAVANPADPELNDSMENTVNTSLHSLTIAGKTYRSRLLVGTGKYKDFAETRAAIDASGAEIVTVAIRRVNIGQNAGEPN